MLGERGGVRDVAPGEANRLLRAAKEPFEAEAAHPSGSAGDCAGDEVEGAADADAGWDGEAVAVHGEPLFLLGVSKGH